MFDGQAGDRVEIIMRATSFDAYLILWFGTPFGEVIAVDDDSYAGTDALIAIQLPYTGPYVIAAAAANGPEHSGGYRISVKLLE